MEKSTLENLQEINWFIDPIADVMRWLFMAPGGRILLFSAFAAYFLGSAINAVYERRLLHRAAKTGFGATRLSLSEFFYIVFREIGKTLVSLFAKLPVLLIILLVLFGTVALSDSLGKVSQFFVNQQKIKELETVVKHLSKRQKVAIMEVVDINIETKTTKLRFSFFDPAQDNKITRRQEVSLKGFDIYLDAMVLNFEYSEIESGKVQNIAVPYRVFSDEIPRKEAIRLDVMDTDNIPLMFHRADEDIYGLSPERFHSHLDSIAHYINDKSAAKQHGIRSFYGEAVHHWVSYKGESFTIWIEQSGGLSIKAEEDF